MSRIWGIHNDRPGLDLVDEGFVSIGWDRIGDLTAAAGDRDVIRASLGAAYPDARPRTLQAWTGVLARFAFELEEGDLVVYPHKPDRTVNVGVVSGPYRFDAEAPAHRHRRTVDWLQTGVPREALSRPLLYELGSALTLFRVRRSAAELEAFAVS